MHFFQLASAWLFPCAVCATLATAAYSASTVEKNSSSSPAFNAGDVNAGTDPASSPSAFSTSTTSSSTSSLLGMPNSARSPEKQGGAAATPKGDAVRRCLRRLAKKLQRARVVDERSDGRRGRRRKSQSRKQADGRVGGVIDGTAREREDAVASAIAYCKETMSGRLSGTSPSPPSPGLDSWLLDRPEEKIGTAGTASRLKCPALRRDVSLLEWLPEAPACTSSATVPHHRGCAACDECGGNSAVETGKRASRRGPTGQLGVDDIYDELDIDVRLTNYFPVKYELVQHRRAALLTLSVTLSKLS